MRQKGKTSVTLILGGFLSLPWHFCHIFGTLATFLLFTFKTDEQYQNRFYQCTKKDSELILTAVKMAAEVNTANKSRINKVLLHSNKLETLNLVAGKKILIIF